MALIANLIVDSAMLLDHQVPPVHDLAHRINDMMVQIMGTDRGDASGGQSDGTDLASDS